MNKNRIPIMSVWTTEDWLTMRMAIKFMLIECEEILGEDKEMLDKVKAVDGKLNNTLVQVGVNLSDLEF